MQHLAAPPGACGAPQAGLRLGRACSSQAAARLRPVQAAARPAGRPVSSSSSSSAAGGRRRSRLGAAAADNGAVERVEPTVALEPAQLDKAIQRAVRQLSGVTASADFDQAELEAAIHRTLKKEIDDEVHAAFAEEMEGVKKNVKEAVDAALHDAPMKVNVTANLNSLMAIMGVILYWRGVGGLLDILLEDSLEGYVACCALGFAIIGLIRVLKLPVVEGMGL